MWFRILPLLCLCFLSLESRSQQKAIDVPFDGTQMADSPIEATGTVSVRETVVGNQVESLWEENVVAKNNSDKPMLLVIGVLEAVGPYSHGGYGVIDDRFFSDPIQPGGKILLATGPYGHVQCCINPLDEPHDPKAAFHVEFVQFVDGSTFGDLARAKDVFVSRTSTLLMLRNLDQTYSDQGEQKFRTRLLQAQSPALFEVLEPIRETAKEEATRAAIAELRKILSLGKKHEAMIGGRLPN